MTGPGRIALRAAAAWIAWAKDYAAYLDIGLSDLIAQALARHAEMTGYSPTRRAPNRLKRPGNRQITPPGPWPKRED